MADQETKSDSCAEENTKNGEQNGQTDDDNLEDFITQQYRLQKENGQMDASDEIDEDRTANFFNRAIKESQRMSNEAKKSQVKMATLHQELGAEIFQAWQHEHATEVLSPDQVDAVMRASQENY